MKALSILLVLLIGARVQAQGVDSDLLKAISEKRFAAARNLILKGADASAADPSGASVAMHALYRGADLDFLKFLAAAGADLRKKGVIWTDRANGSWYGSPLGIAASRGHTAMVQYLIDTCGYSVNDQEIDTTGVHEVGWTPLHYAAQHGHESLMKYLLKKGADPKIADPWGATPLHWAASGTAPFFVKLLLEHGGDQDAKDIYGRTPLHWVARSGKGSSVDHLTKAGAFVEQSDHEGFRPLHRAAWYANISALKDLVYNKANVNASNDAGQTALHLVVKGFVLDSEIQDTALLRLRFETLNFKHYAKIAGFLARHEVDMNHTDFKGRTPMHIAAVRGFSPLVEKLFELGSLCHLKDKEGQTALDLANSARHAQVVGVIKNGLKLFGFKGSQEERLREVKYLISIGSSLNVINTKGRTPLYEAALNGDIPLVKYMLAKGADANQSNSDGNTPLHGAIWQGNYDVAELLIAKGALIDVPNKGGTTVLLGAAANGEHGLVAMLLRKGAKTNHQDADGETALHRAAFKGHLGIVQLLIEHKADPNLVDKNGKTPMAGASGKGHASIVEFLKSSGAHDFSKLGEELCLAVQEGDYDESKRLLELGVVPKSFCEVDFPLIMAITFGHPKVALLLLKHGADPEYTGMDGKTALHCAVERNQQDVVERLVAIGADVDAVTDLGETPLGIAINYGFKEIEKLLRQKSKNVQAALNEQLFNVVFKTFLASGYDPLDKLRTALEAGAEIGALNDQNETVLHLACREGHFAAIKYLVEKGADLYTESDDGWTPIDLLINTPDMWVTFENIDIVRYLIKEGLDVKKAGYSDIWSAVIMEDSLKVRKLIGRKIDPEFEDGDLSMIHWSVRTGNLAITRILIQAGFKVDMNDLNTQTPLHVACQRGNLHLAKLLIDNGADINSETATGERPLDFAADSKLRSFLVQLGAKPGE